MCNDLRNHFLEFKESGNLISKKKLKRVPKTSNRLGVFLKLKCNEQAIYGLNEQDSPGNETEYDDDTQKDTLVERFRFMQESAPSQEVQEKTPSCIMSSLLKKGISESFDKLFFKMTFDLFSPEISLFSSKIAILTGGQKRPPVEKSLKTNS